MATGGDDHPAITYGSYLALDEVLAAQRPRSDEHDELLFIVIHQVYELWFKQMLHELARAQEMLEAGESPQARHTLARILTILKVAVAQIDVLETMTPRQFNGFRGRLDSASGFQSVQFRVIEAVLGRRDGGPELQPVPEAIAAARVRPSLYDSFVRHLARCGYAPPTEVLERDVRLPAEPSPALQDVLLAVYDDDGDAAQIAERLVDLDEGLQEWRYRHVKMVERTIGDKVGTGGSSGTGYLRSTLWPPLFPDLWAVRSRL